MDIDFNQPSINFLSTEWGKVREWLKADLESTLDRLSGDLSEKQTEQFRGRASLLKQMLDFSNQPAARMPQ